MKKQHLLILLAVFVGLFASTKVVEYLGREKGQVKVRDVAKVSADRVDRIEITSQGDPILLQKNGDQWEVTSPVVYPANQAFVQGLVASLSALKSDNIVSTNPENQSSYQVDDAQGTKVVASAGSSELGSLVVGKQSNDGNYTYVRQSGSNDIHAIRGSLRSVFVRPLSEWRDRTILSVSKEVVTKIQVIRSVGENLELVRSGEVWKYSGSTKTINAESIDALLGQTSLLTATGFVDDPTTSGISIETPTLSIILTDQAAKTITLALYAGDKKYYLKKADLDQLFEVGSYVYETFDLTSEALFKPSAAPETVPPTGE